MSPLGPIPLFHAQEGPVPKAWDPAWTWSANAPRAISVSRLEENSSGDTRQHQRLGQMLEVFPAGCLEGFGAFGVFHADLL